MDARDDLCVRMAQSSGYLRTSTLSVVRGTRGPSFGQLVSEGPGGMAPIVVAEA